MKECKIYMEKSSYQNNATISVAPTHAPHRSQHLAAPLHEDKRQVHAFHAHFNLEMKKTEDDSR